MEQVQSSVKPKRCRVCRREFIPARPLQACCQYSCAITYSRGSGDRQSAATKRVRAAEKREIRERHLTLNGAYVLAQKAVNAFVRLRDQNKGCVSCEKGKVEDAGHLFPIGGKYRCNPIRIDPRLIHGQCVECNHHLGGNVHGYLEGLRNRYGQEYVGVCYDIKRMADSGELPKWTKDEVLAKAAEFRAMTRGLSKARAA